MLDDKIMALLSKDFVIRNYIESHYLHVEGSITAKTDMQVRAYSSIIRSHLMNAHSYLLIGQPPKAMDEIKAACDIMRQHDKAEPLRYLKLQALFRGAETYYQKADRDWIHEL